MVRGLEYHETTTTDVYQGCCIGKSTKMSCKRLKEKQSKRILELIYSDLCGPMSVRSISGSRYFMTLIDDYSRKTVVYLLKGKDEVAHRIKTFINKMEREKELKIEHFKTDNGLEYCNKDL